MPAQRTSFERRASSRHPVDASIKLHLGPGDSEPFTLRCRDVGENAIFVHSDILFGLGERFEVEVPWLESGAGRREGWVVRVSADHQGRRGGSGMAVWINGVGPG